MAEPIPSATRSFICMAGVDWWYDSHAHSEVQLMRRIAAGSPVLFVNSIGLRVPVGGSSPQSGRRIVRKVRNTLRFLATPDPTLPDFHVLSPVVLPFYGPGPGRRLRDALIRAQVRVVARRLGLRDPAIVVTMPTASGVVRPMRRRALLFNRADKYSTLRDVDTAAIEAHERDLLEQADRVVYVNRHLMEDDAPIVGPRGHFLDHGVDAEHFTRQAEASLPADVRAIPHPRLGYFGRLDDYKTDIELLEQVADALPDAQLVLVGDATCDLEALTARPNVHWLGPRPYEDIPAYGSAFDVALMPYLQNSWVRNINPIKLKEYLALGLPVVSTEVEEARRYEGLVRFARDRSEFVRLVEEEIARCDDEAAAAARRAAVLDSSWDSLAKELEAMADPTPTDAPGGHPPDDENRLRRVLGALASPATWVHVLRMLNHASYDHVQPRRALRRGQDVRISPTASFRNGERIVLGDRSRIGDRCCLWAGDSGGVIRLGDDALLAPGVYVTTSNYEIPAGEPVIGQPSTSADVTIGARTWLGANVIVLPGVTIGDGCVVGAGSVVTKSLPPESIAVGNPARVVGSRPPRSTADVDRA